MSFSHFSRRNEIVGHGVIIGEAHSAGRQIYTCFMSTGEVWTPNACDITFSIPAIVSRALTIRCGSEPFPTSEAQQNARVELLKRIRLVERALEDKYHVVCASAHNMYQKLRHPDRDKWATTTVSEVANALHLKGEMAIFAVHKFLMNNPVHYIAEPDCITSKKFRVVPLAHCKDLEQVEEWMRIKRGGPLAEFAEKARRVIKRNKEKLRSNFASAPSWRPATHQWNNNDRVILRLLMNAMRLQRSTQSDPYILPVSAILKRLDFESPILKDHELQMTLIDLGVLAPWQDLAAFQPQLDLDLGPEHTSDQVKKEKALVQWGFEKMEQAATNPGLGWNPTQLGPEDFYPKDPLENIRHDFGDMKMYVIDSVNAKELDDGISIERIPLEPDNMWIHVHIADVASVIPPGHVFATDASKRHATTYLNSRAYPLLPPSLLNSPTHGLSLGSRQEGGEPLRVLTFSCKVDAEANILDYQIRAGLVRKVQIIDYDAVDRALGFSSRARYPFGRSPSTADEGTPSLSEQETQDFRDLLSFANTTVLRRLESDNFLTDHAMGEVEFLDGSLPQDLPARPMLQPSEFSGFPSMDYAVWRSSDVDFGSRRIIAEAAKLACRVTSRFGLENDLPLLRRHGPPFVPRSANDLRTLMNARTPDGYVEPHVVAKHIAFNRRTIYTLEPKGHSSMSIPDGEGYVRATSPLRRYSDLMVHWQLHHALLGRAANTAKPPFSDDDMERYKQELTGFELLEKALSKHHGRYWQAMYVHRWMEGIKLGRIDPDKMVEGKNPMEELRAWTQMAPILNLDQRYQVGVVIPSIGTRGVLFLPDHARDADIGTVFNVKLKEVRLGVKPLLKFELKE